MNQAAKCCKTQETLLAELAQVAARAQSIGPEQAARSCHAPGHPLLPVGLYMAADNMSPTQLRDTLRQLALASDARIASRWAGRTTLFLGGLTVWGTLAWGVASLGGESGDSVLWPILGLLAGIGMLFLAISSLYKRMRTPPDNAVKPDGEEFSRILALSLEMLPQAPAGDMDQVRPRLSSSLAEPISPAAAALATSNKAPSLAFVECQRVIQLLNPHHDPEQHHGSSSTSA